MWSLQSYWLISWGTDYLLTEIGRKLWGWIVHHWVLGWREMILLTRWILWITTDCSVQHVWERWRSVLHGYNSKSTSVYIHVTGTRVYIYRALGLDEPTVTFCMWPLKFRRWVGCECESQIPTACVATVLLLLLKKLASMQERASLQIFEASARYGITSHSA